MVLKWLFMTEKKKFPATGSGAHRLPSMMHLSPARSQDSVTGRHKQTLGINKNFNLWGKYLKKEKSLQLKKMREVPRTLG